MELMIMLEEIAKKAESAFKRLQTLVIPPTLDNVEIMMLSLYDIQDIYKMATKEAPENAAADHE